MPIQLPTRNVQRPRRRRPGRAASGADIDLTPISRDPGVSVPAGAFGQQIGSALTFAGDTLFEESQRVTKENLREQLKKEKALDAVNFQRMKLAVNEKVLQTQQRVDTSPHRDDEGNEVDQMGITRDDMDAWHKSTFTKMSSEFKDPMKALEAENYLIGESLKLQDHIIRDRFSKQKGESDAISAQQTNNLKEWVATNPNFLEDPNKFLEYKEKIKEMKSFMVDRLSGGFMSQKEFNQWDIDTADDIGKIRVDQDILSIKQTGNPDDAKKIIEDLLENKYNLKPESITKTVEDVADTLSKFVDDMDKDAKKEDTRIQKAIFSSAFTRLHTELLKEGETLFSAEEFQSLVKPRTVTEVDDDGVVTTKTLPPLLRDPVLIGKLQNAILKRDLPPSGSSDSIMRFKAVSRETNPGESDLDAIERLSGEIDDALAEKTLTLKQATMAKSDLDKWGKEIRKEGKTAITKKKKQVSEALKSVLRPALSGLDAKFIALDRNDNLRLDLLNDLIRVGHARVDKAEKDRAEGKDFETTTEIISDMKSRIDRDSINYKFSEEVQKEIAEALFKKETDPNFQFSPLMAERVLLISRQDMRAFQNTESE